MLLNLEPFLKGRNAGFPITYIYTPYPHDRSAYLSSGVFSHLSLVCYPIDRYKTKYLHDQMAQAPLHDLMRNGIFKSQLPHFFTHCQLPNVCQEAFKILVVDVPHWITNYQQTEDHMAWRNLTLTQSSMKHSSGSMPDINIEWGDIRSDCII